MTTSVGTLLARLSKGANQDPTSARIRADHIVTRGPDGELEARPVPGPLAPGKDYFVVSVDRARLSHGRRWWTDITPMIYVQASFKYDSHLHDVPVILGPDLLSAAGRGAPSAAVFRSLPVIGAHPYVGGGLSLTIVLHEVPTTDAAQRILEAVSTTASAVPAVPALSSYLPLVGAVVNGLGLLLDVGRVRPVMGCRHGMGDVNELASTPGTFVLLERQDVPLQELWVVDGGLCRGDRGETALPVEDLDYVLYSVHAVHRREDAQQLPFFAPLWQRIIRHVSDGEKGWPTANSELNALCAELYLSPDLVRAQAQELYVELRREAARMRHEAEDLAHLGGGATDDTDAVLYNITAAVLGPTGTP